jgi:hypothetical protein
MIASNRAHISKYVAWIVPAVILSIIEFIIMEFLFIYRYPLLPILALCIVIIASIQAIRFITSIIRRKASRVSIIQNFMPKHGGGLGAQILLALILVSLPACAALLFISTRILLNVVPYWTAMIMNLLQIGCVVVMILKASRLKTLKRHYLIHYAILVTILVLILNSTVITELYYPVYIKSFKDTYGTVCQLETAWNISNSYFYTQGYHTTYMKPVPKPGQIFQLRPLGVNWLYSKVFVLAKTGTCEDFAIALATLLHDALGCKTRVVVFKGWDHAVPEVMVNGTWYVFDITYTTPQTPIPANKYYEYLTAYYPEVASSIKGFIGYETGEDISLEHGFPVK